MRRIADGEVYWRCGRCHHMEPAAGDSILEFCPECKKIKSKPEQVVIRSIRDKNMPPVFIFDSDAFDKMVAVEGKDYRRCKSEEKFEVNSFDFFLRYWEESIGNKSKNFLHSNFSYIRPCAGCSSIYGLGGLNRYLVRENGEMVFLVSFDPTRDKQYARKAVEAGFSLNRGFLDDDFC